MNLINKIKRFDPPKYVLYITFALFAVLFIVVGCFHERWYDEANAWLLAREMPFDKLIFVVPKIEGHPPLWWLILAVPAKLGADYVITLTILSLIPSLINAYLIIFRSPFPAAARMVIPFTFYFFYQCGVIARPYGLMILSFLLAAIFYNERNEKPFRFVGALCLMCLTSAYGIIIAGGIAAVWCVKMVLSEKLPDIIKSKRFPALVILLALALFLVYLLSGAENTSTTYTHPSDVFTAFNAIIFMYTAAPALSVFLGSRDPHYIPPTQYFSEKIDIVLPCFICGIIALAVMVLLTYKKKRLIEFIIPYTFFALFCAFYYWFAHHTSVIWMIFLYSLWISGTSGEERSIADNISKYSDPLSSCAVAAGLFVTMLWSVVSCGYEIAEPYACSKGMADYLKDHGLADSYIFAAGGWHAIQVECYLGKDIEYCSDDGHFMMNYKHVEKDEIKYPDVIIGEPDTLGTFGISRSEYILIYTTPHVQAFKLAHTSIYDSMYLRRDLFADYPDVHPQNAADQEFIGE